MFNIAVIGCGDMGTAHVRAWQAREDCKVVAVADADAARLEKLAQSIGAKAYETAKQAIGHAGVEIVSVCTPVCFHAEVACLAANAGKHILCEKPLPLTLRSEEHTS